MSVITAAISLTFMSDRVAVRWVDDEPLAIVAYLKKESAEEADWQKVSATEGYRRLKERELGMGRLFEDDAFRKFLDSPELKRRVAEFEETLARLKQSDYEGLGKRALAYLPADAKIDASVYPLIKPLSNSFVWDLDKNPAIMLYLDPKNSKENYEVTIAHELHHVGYRSCCPSAEFNAWAEKQPEKVRTAWSWVGAFGEGYAVLAAVGGPEPDPVATFGPEKESFREGVRNQAADMKLLESFFSDLAEGKLTGDDATKQGMEFYGEMGPWYSVGYVQAVTIEKAFGRKKLLECYKDPRLLLATYNRAVDKSKTDLPKWSKAFMAKMPVD